MNTYVKRKGARKATSEREKESSAPLSFENLSSYESERERERDEKAYAWERKAVKDSM